MMNNLFTQRRQKHFMLLLKYWRLVFNDHFVIALFFLFGALAYGYSQWLPQLNAHLWWSRWLLVIWFTVLAQLGRLATLIKRPDPIFLLPQVRSMNHYLNQAYRYSVILAGLITVAGTAVALPFAMNTERLSEVDIVVIVVNALLVKENWLFAARKSISLHWSAQHWRTRLEYWGNPFLVAVVTWWINPFAGLALAVLLTLGMRVVYRQSSWKRIGCTACTVSSTSLPMCRVFKEMLNGVSGSPAWSIGWPSRAIPGLTCTLMVLSAMWKSAA